MPFKMAGCYKQFLQHFNLLPCLYVIAQDLRCLQIWWFYFQLYHSLCACNIYKQERGCRQTCQEFLSNALKARWNWCCFLESSSPEKISKIENAQKISSWLQALKARECVYRSSSNFYLYLYSILLSKLLDDPDQKT